MIYAHGNNDVLKKNESKGCVPSFVEPHLFIVGRMFIRLFAASLTTQPPNVSLCVFGCFFVVVIVESAFRFTIAFVWRPRNHEHGICIWALIWLSFFVWYEGGSNEDADGNNNNNNSHVFRSLCSHCKTLHWSCCVHIGDAGCYRCARNAIFQPNKCVRTFQREHFGWRETVLQRIIYLNLSGYSLFLFSTLSLRLVSPGASVVNECNSISMSANLIRKNVIFGHISLPPFSQHNVLLKTDFQSSAYLLWHRIVLAKMNADDVFVFFSIRQ